MKRILAIGLISLGALGSAYAAGGQDAKQIPLKDGATLLIFKDGKMSMRDSQGRVDLMKEGVAMETKDGRTIMMKGNEVWRRTTAEEEYDNLYRRR